MKSLSSSLFLSALLLELPPTAAATATGTCAGIATPCGDIYGSRLCSGDDMCGTVYRTCQNVCERQGASGYNSPCACFEELQTCNGSDCDYEVSCFGAPDCSTLANPLDCFATRGCKWYPKGNTPPMSMPNPPSTIIDTDPELFSPRYMDVRTYLIEQGISSEEDLDTNGSPQMRALVFIAEEDSLELSVPTGGLDTVDGYQFMTRYVLVTLFYATTGQLWTFGLNFLSGASVCFWYSVLQYPDLSTELRGVFCDQETEEVRALFLNQNSLEGFLPSELGLLTSLIGMDFDSNMLRSTIPESFEGLTGLETFFASTNELSGEFPAWIGSWPNTTNINLAFNFLQGSLPSTMGDLHELVGLAIDNNFLSGGLDEIFDTSVNTGLRNLEQIYAENNQFTGILGENFLRAATNLQYLDVSDNEFTGEVSSHLFEFPELLVLDLHDNNFDSLPLQFPQNSALGLLALQKCDFKDQRVPSSISNLSGLLHLDLSQNQFTGVIPDEIGDMSSLTYLFLADNGFLPGPIPSWIGGLDLEELSLKSNLRTGTIPSFLGGLSNLVLLDLDNNFLEGEIPESLGLLNDLQVLLLNRNNLISTIPNSLARLRELRVLYLEGNTELTGDIGPILCDNLWLESNVPIIVADCNLCDPHPGCCSLCCEPGVECNNGTFVPDMDPIWQLGYHRVHFAFNRDDFLDKDRNITSFEEVVVDTSKSAP
ncbi:serine threonine-protein kinase BRI1-like [Seminavis robusta]|uniref:Serine threonine-protein kinase BRI1-like n=1 Tax=Seminavis robusta TaxID=568900 RepID=A0A9N8H9S7_9STRA|nr:serine threonine-protein kinase BRI1-like [Seminavis robusta]|eukprot:Sro217_g089580.1 serine threonine-protein kinase BRI1-like (710) ;mRNA; f:2077-4380